MDEFSFPDGIPDVQKYKQFGNSVTITAIEEMAKFMLDCLDTLCGNKLGGGISMAQRLNVNNLVEKCNIYFEDSLISKERILQEYAAYYSSLLETDGRSVGVTLHTGSILFNALTYIIVALASTLFDDGTVEDTILELQPGDMVLYDGVRYRWEGLSRINDIQYMTIVQDGTGKNGPITTSIPYERFKHLILPYCGDSTRTDGRGIRNYDDSRSRFLSYLFGKEVEHFPAIATVSSVFVADRSEFERIAKGIRISFGQNDELGLLDFATASYYTEGDEYRYGGNPGKNDPLLKITGKISVARDLVLDRSGNRAVWFSVMGAENMLKGTSDLDDLLQMQSLRFIHLSDSINAGNAEKILEICDTANIFACTKEFLLQHSSPVREPNRFTHELDRQIMKIVNNTVASVVIDGGCTWIEYTTAKQSLIAIRNSDWNEEEKNHFVINAYSLLNLFVTAAFPVKTMEEMISQGKFKMNIASPATRINDLLKLAESAGSVDTHCLYITDLLDHLYKSNYDFPPKAEELRQRLVSVLGKRTAVIVPKAYYIDILIANETIADLNVEIVTANRFDHLREYDEVIVLGDYEGKRFKPLNCNAAANITVLLYECETHIFNRKKARQSSFERELNRKNGILGDIDNNTDVGAGNILYDDEMNCELSEAPKKSLLFYEAEQGALDNSIELNRQ